MNLRKKKRLAARVLGVGIGRVTFNPNNLDEIKEAITNQDIKDLEKSKVIIIKEIKGRRKNVKRKRGGGDGRRKKKIRLRKERYVKLTRKLRKHLSELRRKKKISEDQYKKIRIQVKSKMFRSKSHLIENIK